MPRGRPQIKWRLIHQKVREALAEYGGQTIPELSQQLNISEDTVADVLTSLKSTDIVPDQDVRRPKVPMERWRWSLVKSP